MRNSPNDADTRAEIAGAARDLREGKPGAFQRLFDLTHHRVYRFSLFICGNPELAHDLCQDAFLKLHRSIASLKDERRFLGWAMMIVRNLYIDQKRSVRDQPGLRAEEVEEALLEEVTPHCLEEILTTQAVCRELSVDDRALILLIHMEGHSCEEVAEIIGSTTKSVKVRVHRARQRFKKIFESR